MEKQIQIQTPLPFSEVDVKEPVLGAYTDFRRYLRDFYDFKIHQYRNSFSSYNYKTFSAAADIKSPNYLKLIIDGGRNLSPVTARKFAKALGLDKDGADEFLLLVQYGQSMSPLERNQHLSTLNEYRTQRRIKSGELKVDKSDSVPRWVSWVLHAMADQKDVVFSADALRDLLQCKVTAEDIRKSLHQLFETKALQLDPKSGKVKKGLTPPNQEDLTPEMIRKIQSELMYLGMEALLNDKTDEREIGTLTVSLTENEFEKIKFELRHLRKRILKDALVAREQAPGDKVYQLNIQMFPLTKKAPRIN
jgi:uncharacterized protein (TIGR02147 family)